MRQRENLSHILFCLFLNNLDDFLQSNGCSGINFEVQHGDILTYLKILILLYADDTVIFATDSTTFQRNLDIFFEYTRLWKLSINYSKTKVMLFGVRNVNNFRFHLDGNLLEITDYFKYLGVYFSKTRTFYKTRKHSYDQARKAMHLLLMRIRRLNLPLDLQLKIFDHTVVPILLYGSEIWGFENTEIIEKLHNEFLRKITGLRKSTPIYILQAELGRYPLKINIKIRMLNYWFSVVNGKQNKLSYLVYKSMLNDSEINMYTYKWINYIKETLQSVGRNDIWISQQVNNAKGLKLKISEILKNQEMQLWHERLEGSSKGIIYRIFKHNIKFESYLTLIPESYYIPILKFRTSNHKLPVETGRWENVQHSERKCLLCNADKIGDEFHYLFECSSFRAARHKYLSPFFIRRPNTYKFDILFNSTKAESLKKLSSFVSLICKSFP